MIILILIDIQYLQSVFSSLEKGWNGHLTTKGSSPLLNNNQFSCYNPVKASFLAVVIAHVPFLFNFILSVHIGHANFDFNLKRLEWSKSLFLRSLPLNKKSPQQNPPTGRNSPLRLSP